MQIDIKTYNLPMTETIRRHSKRRLGFALSCCDDYIQRVVISLSDINGPRGGEDKRCRLQIVLAGIPDVVVEDTAIDLYVVIDRATDRAGRTVRRKIDRQKTLFRQSRSPALTEA